MTSVDPTLTTTLLANVRRLGLTHTAEAHEPVEVKPGS